MTERAVSPMWKHRPLSCRPQHAVPPRGSYIHCFPKCWFQTLWLLRPFRRKCNLQHISDRQIQRVAVSSAHLLTSRWCRNRGGKGFLPLALRSVSLMLIMSTPIVRVIHASVSRRQAISFSYSGTYAYCRKNAGTDSYGRRTEGYLCHERRHFMPLCKPLQNRGKPSILKKQIPFQDICCCKILSILKCKNHQNLSIYFCFEICCVNLEGQFIPAAINEKGGI